ncbi:MAG: hypothetical protein JW811_09685 [Clostridiales bacterium]|nr:hypothetical protein [Clostridiales bacterium]
MPDDIYEIVSLAARYWFLLLMFIIAWRSYRWYVKDRKKFKRRVRLLPDAGYIGELVVVQGDDILKKGTCLPVNREGVLGYLRSNDVCVPAGGIANRHMWYTFDDTDGLRVEPMRGRMIIADGEELIGRRMRAYLAHGSTLTVGQAKMRLRMFSGFEYAGETGAQRRPLDDDETTLPEELADAPHSDPVRRMHEIAAWQTMMEDEENEEREFYPPEMDDTDEEDEYPPPADEPGPNAYELQDGSQVFYPPVDDGKDEAAIYAEEDEAEKAKRALWDRLFRGGKNR